MCKDRGQRNIGVMWGEMQDLVSVTIRWCGCKYNNINFEPGHDEVRWG